MASEKKLYRSRDSLAGGVCTGIAEYFNIDPIIVQILTVVLTIATAGLVLVAYIALWIILPRAPKQAVPVDVEAHEVRSDTYGDVTNYATKHEGGSDTSEPSARQTAPYEAYAGSAHVPPPPPKEYGESEPPPYGAPFASGQPVGTPKPAGPNPDAGPTQPCVAQQPQVAAPPKSKPPQQVKPPSPGQPQQKDQYTSANGALWFGFILLFVGLSALFSTFVEGVEWWQFWPLVFVIVGIGQMVVPGKKGHRMSHFVNGIMMFAFGGTALALSLQVVTLSSIESILLNVWPLLVIMAGFFVLGGATRSSFFTLLGGLTFVAFCVVGIGWFSYPGPTDILTITLPTGQVYLLDINPWS